MNEQASKSSPTSRHDDPPPRALSGRRARAKCSALADWPASHTRSARLLRSRAVKARPGRRAPSAWKPLLLRADRTAASTCLQRRGADEDAADPRQGCPVGCGSRLLTYRGGDCVVWAGEAYVAIDDGEWTARRWGAAGCVVAASGARTSRRGGVGASGLPGRGVCVGCRGVVRAALGRRCRPVS